MSRRCWTLFALLLLTSPVRAVDPIDLALADLAKLPAEAQQYQRYHFGGAFTDDKEWAEFRRLYEVSINGRSREADLERPIEVAPRLLRFDLRWYGWPPELYDRLGEDDPYYHQIRDVEEEYEQEFGYWTRNGIRCDYDEGTANRGNTGYAWTTTRTEKHKRKVRKRATLAAWLLSPEETRAVNAGKLKEDQTRIGLLATLTHSRCPILLADWFWTYTLIQEGRKVGYYDLLGLKKRDDFFRLVGLDVKTAQRVHREVAAIVKDSGVSRDPRQIFRFGAPDAGYWFTKDVITRPIKGAKDAVSKQDDEFKHEAEEHYGVLPNRLFAHYLCTDKGVQQDTAPDGVGPDKTSTSNDPKIHPGLCDRCHRGTLRPIKDFARRLFRDPVRLENKDYEVFKRRKQLYLGEYQERLESDVSAHSKVLKRFSGWEPAEYSLHLEKWYRRLAEDEVEGEEAAARLGCRVADLQGAVTRYKLLARPIDPVIDGLTHDPPESMTRPQYEERYELLQEIMRGYIREVKP